MTGDIVSHFTLARRIRWLFLRLALGVYAGHRSAHGVEGIRHMRTDLGRLDVLKYLREVRLLPEKSR